MLDFSRLQDFQSVSWPFWDITHLIVNQLHMEDATTKVKSEAHLKADSHLQKKCIICFNEIL